MSDYTPTTEEVRSAWMDGLASLGAEFDRWYIAERKRVAQMAIKKERARILAVLEAAICDCDADCKRIDTTFSELQTKIEEL